MQGLTLSCSSPWSIPLQITATLKGHTKKVTSVLYHMSGNKVVSASPDSTIRVWDVDRAAPKTIIKVTYTHLAYRGSSLAPSPTPSPTSPPLPRPTAMR